MSCVVVFHVVRVLVGVFIIRVEVDVIVLVALRVHIEYLGVPMHPTQTTFLGLMHFVKDAICLT